MNHQERAAGRLEWCVIVLASAVASVASVMAQGFRFESNSLFYVPLALDWMNDPAFAGDAFIASLSNFTSGAWVILRLFTTETNFENVFLYVHVANRCATILALIFAASTLNVSDLRSRLLLIIVFAFSPLLQGPTAVGQGDLLAASLGHTQLTNPLIIMSLAFMAQRRIVISVAITGLVFNLNAFVAVWNGVALLFAAIYLGLSKTMAWQAISRRMLIGLAIGALIALPMALWILDTLSNNAPAAAFSYSDYLHSYYPLHFFISAAKPSAILTFVAIAAAGTAAIWVLDGKVRAWAGAFAGFITLFAFGTVLPELTSSSLLLNLHLLRVDHEVQLVAVLLVSATTVKFLAKPSASERLLGATALLFLAVPLHGVILLSAMLLLKASRRIPEKSMTALVVVSCAIVAATLDYNWPRQIALGGLALVATVGMVFLHARIATLAYLQSETLRILLILAFAASASLTFHDQIAAANPRVEAILEAAKWAKENTPEHGTFLIPPDDVMGATQFQIASHRKVWVDWKRGAAVMWMPSYYHEWSSRLSEVRALVSLDQKVKYSCRLGLDYVVHEKSAHDAGDMTAAFANKFYTVIHVDRQPTTGLCEMVSAH